MGKSTSYQLKGVNPIQFLALFQNIQFTAAEDLLQKKTKQSKATTTTKNKKQTKQTKICATRTPGRIFMRPIFTERPKECNVSVERNCIPVSCV